MAVVFRMEVVEIYIEKICGGQTELTYRVFFLSGVNFDCLSNKEYLWSSKEVSFNTISKFDESLKFWKAIYFAHKWAMSMENFICNLDKVWRTDLLSLKLFVACGNFSCNFQGGFGFWGFMLWLWDNFNKMYTFWFATGSFVFVLLAILKLKSCWA